jgi:hypothetical protein
VILRLALGIQLLPICFPLLLRSFFDAKERTKESLAESKTLAMLPSPLSVENGPACVRNGASAHSDRFPNARIARLAFPIDSAEKIRMPFTFPNVIGILHNLIFSSWRSDPISLLTFRKLIAILYHPKLRWRKVANAPASYSDPSNWPSGSLLLIFSGNITRSLESLI